MPAFKWCGHSYLIAADDFVFIFPWFIPLHLVWVALNFSSVVEETMQLIQVPPHYKLLDSAILLFTIPLDFIISVLSARGQIMEPRQCEATLKFFIATRFLCSVPLVVLFAVDVHLAVSYFWREKDSLHKALPLVHEGWGPEFQKKWDVYLTLIVIALRASLYLLLVGLFLLMLVPKKVRNGVLNAGMRTLLFLLGCRDNMVNGLMSIIMNDLGGTTSLDKVSPTDWIFGIFLVSYRQGQGFLGADPDAPPVVVSEERTKILTRTARRGQRKLPPNTMRASELLGLKREVTPFDPTSPEDQAVVRDLVRFMPYASGIYGQQFGVSLLMDSVQPGTHLVSPLRACRSCCRSLPCIQAHFCDNTWECLRRLCCCVCCFYWCAPAGRTEGDTSTALNEDALTRAVVAGAKRLNSAEPELVFASWKNLGPNTTPPIGVLVDHQRKEIVVTIRGTADMKDALADVGGLPLFFDPFGWAKDGDRRKHPFTNEDLFVHGSVLLCAEDAHHRLRHKRILEDLVFGRCQGYGIVCVGHSLGAGVACLLAMILIQQLPKDVKIRYVGFEPPGGLLCGRLSRETQRRGWTSVACSHDWVPRIGVRNLQKLKVIALDELMSCDRSKLQLSFLLGSGLFKALPFLCCLRHPLAALFRCLGGGPLPPRVGDNVDNQAKFATDLEAGGEDSKAWLMQSQDGGTGTSSLTTQPSAFRSELTFPDLWPPGDIIYLRPLANKKKCCGWMEKDTEWTAEWADPQDLDEIVLAARSIDLHVPWVYEDAVYDLSGAFDEEALANPKAASAKEQRVDYTSRSLRLGFELS